MTRFRLNFWIAILLPLNFLFAKQSSTTWQPITAISSKIEVGTDSLDAAIFVQLSRKEYEAIIGHTLTKQERRDFRKVKKEVRRQMPSEKKSKWWIGIVIGGGLILAGLITYFFGLIKDSECENPPYCEKGDTEKALGSGLMVGGILAGIVSGILAAKSKKVEKLDEKQ